MTPDLPHVVAVLPGAVPFCLVAGYAGHQSLWLFLDDAGRVRTIGHARGVPVCIPDRPLAKGAPSLADLMRGAIGGGAP